MSPDALPFVADLPPPALDQAQSLQNLQRSVEQIMGVAVAIFLVTMLIISLAAAWHLCLVTRWVLKKPLGFGSAYQASWLAGLTVLGINVIAFFLGLIPLSPYQNLSPDLSSNTFSNAIRIALSTAGSSWLPMFLFLAQARVLKSRLQTTFGSACVIIAILQLLLGVYLILFTLATLHRSYAGIYVFLIFAFLLSLGVHLKKPQSNTDAPIPAPQPPRRFSANAPMRVLPPAPVKPPPAEPPTYRILCPHCDQKISVEAERQASIAQCPTCGGEFQIPNLEDS